MLDKIPQDIWSIIIEFIPADERLNVLRVCRYLSKIKWRCEISCTLYRANFDRAITINMVTNLTILGPFNGSLPERLTTLCIGGRCNQPLALPLVPGESTGKLPDELTALYIDGTFNQPLGDLPEGLKILNLDGRFNKPLGVLPKNLEEFTTRGEFNQPLGDLPPKMLCLRLYGEFNQPLGSLPNGLKSFYVGRYFDRPITEFEDLPSTLIDTNIYDYIWNIRPRLKTIYINRNFRMDNFNFPNNIDTITYINNTQQNNPHNILNASNSLSIVYPEYQRATLPIGLTSLVISIYPYDNLD